MGEKAVPIVSISSIIMRTMRAATNGTRCKPILHNWYTSVVPSGQVVHRDRYFFAWKDGCLIGTYTTRQEARESLAAKEGRRTH